MLRGMRRLLAALFVVGAIAQASSALADCTCRGRNGTAVALGGYACLTTADGPRLARCEMVLNNSSWQSTGESCPMALFSPILRPIDRAAMTATRVAFVPAPHGTALSQTH